MRLMAALEMWKVVPKANCFRRYKISEQLLLFGGYDLVLEWGRIGATVRCKHETCCSIEELAARREEIIQKRRRHGYRMVA
jgi:predicted DNA-binding WGR domain protein